MRRRCGKSVEVRRLRTIGYISTASSSASSRTFSVVMSSATSVSASRICFAWRPSMPVTVTCSTCTSELLRSHMAPPPSARATSAIKRIARRRGRLNEGIHPVFGAAGADPAG